MKVKFDITGMGCSACSARIQNGVSQMTQVKSCEVNLLTNSMECELDSETAIDEVIKKVCDLGYGASIKEDLPSRQ